jgi:hypothetical protein
LHPILKDKHFLNIPVSLQELAAYVSKLLLLEPYYTKYDPKIHQLRQITIDARNIRKYGTVHLCNTIPPEGIRSGGTRAFVVIKREVKKHGEGGVPRARAYIAEHEREVFRSQKLFEYVSNMFTK